jgi:hypothetical protein
MIDRVRRPIPFERIFRDMIEDPHGLIADLGRHYAEARDAIVRARDGILQRHRDWGISHRIVSVTSCPTVEDGRWVIGWQEPEADYR